MKFVIDKNTRVSYMTSIMVLVIACLLLLSSMGLFAPDTLLVVNVTAILIAVTVAAYTFLFYSQQNKAKQKLQQCKKLSACWC